MDSSKTGNFRRFVSSENNLNDLSKEQIIPKSQNSKKPVTKHFMSPTVSAVSKASAPRKKILAERIENTSSFDGKFEKSPTFDTKKNNRTLSVSHSNRSTSPDLSFCNHVSEGYEDGETNFVTDSPLRPYDPLVNYLTPRPKYLRFNPIRRREIFLRQKEEGREDLNGSHDSHIDSTEEEACTEDGKNSPVSPRKEIDLNQGNEEGYGKEDESFDDDYEEEFEEERGCCLTGVLKFLLILIAYFLSTSYICSMNSPAPSRAQLIIWGLKDGYLTFRKQTLQAITIKRYEASFLAVGDRDSYGEVDKVAVVKDDNVETGERVGDKMPEVDNKVGIGEGVEAVMVEDAEVNLEDHWKEFDGNDTADDEDSVDEIFSEVSPPEDAKTEDLMCCEVKSKAESFEPKTGESEDAGETMSEEEVDSTNQLHKLEISVKSAFGQEEDSPQHSPVADGAKLPEPPIGSNKQSVVEEADEIGYGQEVETGTTKWNTSVVIGASVLSIILASTVLFYHSMRARSTCAKGSQLMLKPHKPALGEKDTTGILGFGQINDSSAKLALTRSMEKVPGELNHYTRTLTAELVGEVLVGELSSSLGSFYMKSQTSESEESNATFPPNLDSLSQPVPTPTQPSSTPEFSTISSPSYRRFTTEKKRLKEGGKEGEAKVGVTPVRRSSRLRNRTAVSSP